VRVRGQVAQAVDAVVALPIGQRQPVRVEHAHETGVTAAGRDVGPAGGGGGRQGGEGGEPDEGDAVLVEVVDDLVPHPLGGGTVAGEHLGVGVHGPTVAAAL